jgi:hypothetical protein
MSSKNNKQNIYRGRGAFIGDFKRARKSMTNERAKILIGEAGGVEQYFSKKSTLVIEKGDIVIDIMAFPEIAAAIAHIEEQSGGKCMIVSPDHINNNLVIKRLTSTVQA